MNGETKIIRLSNGYNVWTRRVGRGDIKILLLHGGPGMTHEYLESLSYFLPQEGVELYFYDQLGSYYSDQPDDPSLWTMDRFKDEVEEVRRALGLEDFYLYGSSWGGFLAIEYALHYKEGLRGLILSNTTASIDAYTKYVNELRSRAPKEVQDKWKFYEERKDYDNEEYNRLLDDHLNNLYICRLDPWPEPALRSFANLGRQVYETLHGPNEFLVTGNHKEWNRWDRLDEIKVPTLILGAKYDSMSLEDQEKMHRLIPNSSLGICPKGSHLSMWDDQENYFKFFIDFLRVNK